MHVIGCRRSLWGLAVGAAASLLLALPGAAGAAGPSVSFAPGQTLPGQGANSAVAPDLDGDGDLDLVVTNTSGDSVQVFRNFGNGTFVAGQQILTGDEPAEIVSGDLDGDGQSDLAVANATVPGRVWVLLGAGDGSFSLPAGDHPVSGRPTGLALGDFNGDGRPDLAVAEDSGAVEVLLGAGSGGFSLQMGGFAGAAPRGVAAADVDGDGRQDLAVAARNENRVAVLRGNGDGTFLPRTLHAAGTAPADVAVADLDDDGRPDLLAPNPVTSSVSTLLGAGDGGFSPPQSHPAGNFPVSVAVAELNGDGILDVVVPDRSGSAIGVLQGDGGGTFEMPRMFGTGAGPVSVVAADLDSDGRPDLTSMNEVGDDVSVLLNTTDTTRPSVTITTPGDGAGYPQGSTVIADYSCSDASGVASCTGTVPDGAAIDTSTTGTRSFSVTAKDTAGNETTKTVSYTVTDVVAPAITITRPQDGASYPRYSRVLASYSCSDGAGGTGVASCTGTVPNGQPIDTSTTGTRSFTVTAVDNAGNTSSKTVTYTVTPCTITLPPLLRQRLDLAGISVCL